MIHYSLICDALHEFDGWFRDSAAFDAQAADGAIACPFCRSVKVGKAVMAPHVARPVCISDASAGAREGEESQTAPALVDDGQDQLRAKLRELRETLLSATEDVGARFPAEARKIQEGEAKPRPIRGRASLAEAKALVEDGIEILPLPGEGH
jgi:hypothetical protein